MSTANTALDLITAAFEGLNVFLPGESIPAPQALKALGWLNRMIGGWAVESLTIPAIARRELPVTAGKGGPSNPYSVGPGGDYDIPRPPSQANLVGAGLMLNASTPPVEIPRAVLTDDAYDGIAIKELQNVLFTSVYYNPTYAATGLGTLHLWPVPDTALNTLILYLQEPLSRFADLATTYYLPDGYDDAIVYNLQRRLAKPWGAVVDAELIAQATRSLMLVKRANLKLTDIPSDFPRMGDLDHGYNILTGNM
jgi:hypothetical protein